ncbi:catalase family protein [Derxia gummosa]|uniref:Catalase family protein n=1 Tax=Derxia gummosa DSM 723 TaxID=1121388 RepID=A0A8B6X504_9BURK|nr:catalase family protein [Derxia gummosa]
MSTAVHLHPVLYKPALEVAPDDEAETARLLREGLLDIAGRVAADEGHAHRAVHAKSHGLLVGELRVRDDLPLPLAQGLFARPGARHDVVMRLSTTPGDLLPDSVSTPRGLALKVLGVRGPRVPESGEQATQDFVMVNGPAFSAPSARKFLGSLKLLAKTTDRLPRGKQLISAALQGLEALIEKAGGDSVTLRAMGGQPETHILGETFHTQVPTLHGPYMAKYSVAPVSPELLAHRGAPIDTHGHPDALREAVVAHFRRHGGVWELRAQLCMDLERMPVEDASVVWPEELSPHVTVATLVFAPQLAWSPARAAAIDDGMAFNPWHALAAHRPIGSIMRVRKAAYEMAAGFRAARNRVTITEPASAADIPD